MHRLAAERVGDQIRAEAVGTVPVGGDFAGEREEFIPAGGAIEQYHRFQDRSARNPGEGSRRSQPDSVFTERADQVFRQSFGGGQDDGLSE
ncbi:hypothetical protein SDC9_135651 [bioreactor metagenome]|uniref:Uncharacterized protein n=1 Tax=bioreactor metagenome TaxID=1076179 RepID=A0A645DH08_9ZZZZ